jgi:xanthosine utilization system XapX-like protein
MLTEVGKVALLLGGLIYSLMMLIVPVPIVLINVLGWPLGDLLALSELTILQGPRDHENTALSGFRFLHQL